MEIKEFQVYQRQDFPKIKQVMMKFGPSRTKILAHMLGNLKIHAGMCVKISSPPWQPPSFSLASHACIHGSTPTHHRPSSPLPTSRSEGRGSSEPRYPAGGNPPVGGSTLMANVAPPPPSPPPSWWAGRPKASPRAWEENPRLRGGNPPVGGSHLVLRFLS